MKVEIGPREIRQAVSDMVGTLFGIPTPEITSITFTKIPKTSDVRAVVEVRTGGKPLDGSEQ